MNERQSADKQAFGTMIVLCMLWALPQIAIKIVGDDIAPLMQISIRSGISALLVGLFMFFRRERLTTLFDGSWKAGIAVGFFHALEFFFIGEGLRFTSTSHLVVFLYTAPIFAALGLHWRVPAERLKPLQWGGIAAAFLGIVIAFSGPAEANLVNSFVGDLFGLLAGASWGATTVLIRTTRLSNAPATQTLLWQLISACVLLVVVAIPMGQSHLNFTPAAVGSILFQAVIISFVSYLVWFQLLRKYLASQLGILSFMTPFFGVIFGSLFLDEPLDANFLIGAVFVSAGIVIVLGYSWILQFIGKLIRRQA